MRALLYTGPDMLEVRDVADPVPGPGEVVVDVALCGICGSDMHAYHGHDERRPAPLVLGHEAAGVIATGPDAGLRVTINPLVTCGECEACRLGRDNLCPRRQIISMPPRPGGLAERVAIPRGNCVPVPDGVSDAMAALVEPVACGWHAVQVAARVLGRPVAGLDVLILGGGAIGVGAAVSAMAWGAVPLVIEPHPGRRARLQALQRFAVAAEAPAEAPAKAPAKAPGRAFGFVIDAVGIEATRRAACAAVMPGGAIIHIGLGGGAGGIDTRRLTLHEIAFVGTYTYTAQDFRDTAAALFAGRLGPADWHETRPLAEGPETFEALGTGRVDASKVMLSMRPQEE